MLASCLQVHIAYCEENDEIVAVKRMNLEAMQCDLVRLIKIFVYASLLNFAFTSLGLSTPASPYGMVFAGSCHLRGANDAKVQPSERAAHLHVFRARPGAQKWT